MEIAAGLVKLLIGAVEFAVKFIWAFLSIPGPDDIALGFYLLGLLGVFAGAVLIIRKVK